MQIVLYGDSTFKRLNKVDLLTLEKLIPGAMVHNCSIGGLDTHDAHLRASFLSYLPADKFVLCFGLNDAAPWKQIPLQEFIDNVKKLIDILGASRTIFFLPPSVDESRQEGETKRTNFLLGQYQDAARAVCRERDILCLDLSQVFERVDDIHLEDGVHLNAVGNQVMMVGLASALRVA